MHDAFLAAIADRPDDDLPRLVYADWLDENGDPDRAEFIRCQIELAKLSEHDPRRAELEDREEELLIPHKGEWGLPEFRGQSQVMCRGFVERVNVEARWLIARPRVLDAPGPLRTMRVFGASAFIGQLAEVPGLARLETLDLSNTQFARTDDVRRFFTSARLDGLRSLVLRNSNFWEGEELAALADTPIAPRLRSLDISGTRVGDGGARVLAERAEFGWLESLTFRADEVDRHSCVTSVGAEALAESATLTRLKSLDLGDHYIGNEGLRALASGPNAHRLERLGVEYNDIDDDDDNGILAVVESSRLANLRELRFGGNHLGRVGAEALAAWPHLERMESLDLQEGPLTDAVRAILTRSPWADRFVL
jgi:uncharacterized protein (TIGR02996 family)